MKITFVQSSLHLRICRSIRLDFILMKLHRQTTCSIDFICQIIFSSSSNRHGIDKLSIKFFNRLFSLQSIEIWENRFFLSQSKRLISFRKWSSNEFVVWIDYTWWNLRLNRVEMKWESMLKRKKKSFIWVILYFDHREELHQWKKKIFNKRNSFEQISPE